MTPDVNIPKSTTALAAMPFLLRFLKHHPSRLFRFPLSLHSLLRFHPCSLRAVHPPPVLPPNSRRRTAGAQLPGLGHPRPRYAAALPAATVGGGADAIRQDGQQHRVPRRQHRRPPHLLPPPLLRHLGVRLRRRRRRRRLAEIAKRGAAARRVGERARGS
jgi:hypothetical protein